MKDARSWVNFPGLYIKKSSIMLLAVVVQAKKGTIYLQ